MNTLDAKTVIALTLLSIRRHKLITFLTFILILLPIVVVGMMKKPVYVAKATVLIKQSNYSTSSLGNRVYTPRSLGIQLAILKSQYLAGKVIDALPEKTLRDLEENAEYTDYQQKVINLIRTTLGKVPIVINPREKAADELRNARMEFSGMGLGGIIQISGESTRRDVSLDLVNAYIDVFKEISSHFALEQQADLDRSLSLQILNAQSLLKKSEDDLLSFQNKSRSKDGKHRKVDVSSYLSQESGMLSALRIRRSELLLTETRSHPDVVAVSQEIDEIEKKIGKIQDISKPGVGRVDVTGTAWESFLESNIKMDKALLGELEEERSSSRIVADSNLENLIVIDPPLKPMKPEMTKGFKIMALGVVAAFGGSVGVPFLLVFFRKPVQGENNLKKLTGRPNFANIPRIPSKAVPEKNGVRVLRVDQAIDRESFWIFQKEFEAMFFRIKQSLKSQKGQVILITSPAPEDGKSMTSLNLALTMSLMGHRTIILDADSIRGRVIQNLGNRDSFMAEEFIPEGEENTLRINWSENQLAVIKTGKMGEPNFWTSHSETVIAKWFEILRYQADFIIIDSPPILASTDLLSISGLVDGVLIVVRNNVTTERDLMRVESVLEEHHFELLGTVLNDSKSPHIQYSYGYSKRHEKSLKEDARGKTKEKKAKKGGLAV
ncbi:MAG: polysaccharide biosynthesis tyrosine autokinase [Leptospirales bacterium]